MKLDWHKIFVHDLDFRYGLEVLFRTCVMFLIILLVIRLSGKRGVRQLSIFEIAIIISLGSAAGDPMFYKDVAIIPALFVCSTIIVLYRFITWLTAKNEHIEKWVEGEPIYIVENGMFAIENIAKDSLAKDEFFAELRQFNIEHLGQVKTAILETNGSVSVIFCPNEELRYGLPILPRSYNEHTHHIITEGTYACAFCGQVERLALGVHNCSRCRHKEWVTALNNPRIS